MFLKHPKLPEVYEAVDLPPDIKPFPPIALIPRCFLIGSHSIAYLPLPGEETLCPFVIRKVALKSKTKPKCQSSHSKEGGD